MHAAEIVSLAVIAVLYVLFRFIVVPPTATVEDITVSANSPLGLTLRFIKAMKETWQRIRLRKE